MTNNELTWTSVDTSTEDTPARPANNTGLSAKEYARIVKLAAKHAEELGSLSAGLATNYEVPAQRLINYMLAQTGISRIDYEKIVAVQGNHPYEKPPARLLARWARY